MILAYIRRLHTSSMVLLPGIVVITFSLSVVFILQIPVILSFDVTALNNASLIDFVFWVTYEILLLFLVGSFVLLTRQVKAKVVRVYSYVGESGSTSRLNIQYSSHNYGSIISALSEFESTPRLDCFIGRVFFWDAWHLLRFGYKNGLQSIENLIPLPKKFSAESLLEKFSNFFYKTLNSGNPSEDFIDELSCCHDRFYLDGRTCNISLLRILLRCYGVKYFLIGAVRFLSDALSFSAPFLLGKLIDFVSESSQPLSYGGILSAGLFLASFLGALTNTWFTYLIQSLTLQVRSTLIVAIFSKCLITPHAILNSHYNSGQLLTFLSTDTDRAANMLPSFHSVWSLPFQIAIAFYLLYNQLGLYFLAGVILAVAMIPLNFVICRKIVKLTEEMLTAKDERVDVCSEMLQGMKVVKLFGWESVFVSKIASIRLRELWRCLKWRKLLDAFCVYFWATVSIPFFLFSNVYKN